MSDYRQHCRFLWFHHIFLCFMQSRTINIELQPLSSHCWQDITNLALCVELDPLGPLILQLLL